jgi:hypothetical protein
MPAPKKVLKLVERFERNRDAYRSSDYNEAQVRLELINPLFKALGWDVDNEKTGGKPRLLRKSESPTPQSCEHRQGGFDVIAQ